MVGGFLLLEKPLGKLRNRGLLLAAGPAGGGPGPNKASRDQALEQPHALCDANDGIVKV
jgi:hypothetical protein